MNDYPDDDLITEQLAATVFAYLDADTWTLARQIVQKNPELLSDTAISFISNLITKVLDDPISVSDLQLHLNVLKDCRRLGIKVAFKQVEGEVFLTGTKLLIIITILLGICVGITYSLTWFIPWVTVIKGLFLGVAFIISIGWIFWEAAWYFGNHGFVPIRVRILVVRSMFLQLGLDWRFIKLEPDQGQEMRLLLKALQEAVNYGKNGYLVASLHDYIGGRWRHIQIGERVANLEQSCFHYREALKFFTKEAWIKPWLQTQLNLIYAYLQKASLSGKYLNERANDFLEILTLFSEVFDVSDQLALPDRANLHLDYARTLVDIHELTALDTLETALESCKLALTIFTESTNSAEWARGNEILGEVYSGLHDWISAVGCYERASLVFNRNTSAYDWIHVQLKLGYVYYQLYNVDQISENLTKSIYCCELAREAYAQSLLPWSATQATLLLAEVYFTANQWQSAYDALKMVIDYKQEVFVVAYTPLGRLLEVASAAELHPRAAYCLLKLNRFNEALVCLETGKTRLFWEALALHGSDLESLPDEYKHSIQDLRQEIHNCEIQYRLLVNLPSKEYSLITISSKLESLRKRFNNLLAQIRQAYPQFMPANLDLVGILATIPANSCLVTSICTSEGSAIILAPQGVSDVNETHVIWLNEFKKDDLNNLLTGNEETPGWLREYAAYREDNTGTGLIHWQRVIEKIGKQIWEQFIAPLYVRLCDFEIKRIVFMPNGGLSLLPIHAAWKLIEGQKHYFTDDCEISFAPSAYALHVAKYHIAAQEGKLALIVGINAYRPPLSPLQYSRSEAEGIAALFKAILLVDADATHDAVIVNTHEKTYLHFSCHGIFAWGDDPMASGLHLHDAPLTLSQIIGTMNLSTTRLVTLSACDTGITDVRRSPDEFIGLPAGFMQAGATGVVSSLWAVDDRSTALLMERFYKNHLNNAMSPAAALREAQIWLRELTRAKLMEYLEVENAPRELRRAIKLGGAPEDRIYESPHYWAAFIFNGV